ncbi:MAG: DUF2894 domain-containing protein [Rhizobacter sp.]
MHTPSVQAERDNTSPPSVEAERDNTSPPSVEAERDNTPHLSVRAEPFDGAQDRLVEASADLGVAPSTALQTEAVEAALTTWRAQTAPTLPATHVFFIEALARRAALLQGETRQHLNQKLLQALTASTPHSPSAPAQTATPDPSQETDTAINALTALRQQLDAQATAPARTAWRTQNATSLRATWSALHAQQRVTHALASKPPQAGPLNSEQLVHRSLLLMRDVSPAYLQHFVATIDALSWAEQLHRGHSPMGHPVATSAPRSKTPRGKGS